MRLEQYLLSEKKWGASDEFSGKHRSKDLSYDECLKELRTGKYSDMINYISRGGVPMMRGSRYGSYAYIDPYKSAPRKSMYTSNYYTLLMSKLSVWKKFPPREYAVICSTNRKKASDYGNVVYVLPQNGSKIGVTSSNDLWGSFGKYIGSGNEEYDGPLGKMNDAWDELFGSVFSYRFFENIETSSDGQVDLSKVDKDIDLYIVDEDFDMLKRACNSITKIINNKGWEKTLVKDGWSNLLAYANIYEGHHIQTIGKMFKKYNDMWKVMQEMYDPKVNNFKLAKSGDKLPNKVEVWTDGKCLMISEDDYDIVSEI